MADNKQDLTPKHRLMFTAGATTLAATGAVFGAAMLNQNQTASADQVQGQTQVSTGQQSQWKANSLDQVKAAIAKQGKGSDIRAYAAQWGDTLEVIAQAYGLSTDQAAQQLGLEDQGVLISGYRLGDQAQVIQKLKSTGVLLSSGVVQTSQGQGDQPNLVLMQKGAPVSNRNQVVADSQANSQRQNQNSQTGSRVADTAFSQSVAESQSLSVANSQSVALDTNSVQTSHVSLVSDSNVGSQSADLYSQTQSLSQAQVASSQAPASQSVASQAASSQAPASQSVASQAASSQAPASQSVASQAASSQAPASQSVASQAASSQAPASQSVASQTASSQAPASQSVASQTASSQAPASQSVASQAASSQAPASQSVASQAASSQAPASQAPASTSATAQPTAATNKVNTEQVINWFYDHQGKLTYSMTGSRDGADGTADCSGAMTEALYEAGASKPAYLYNTDSLHGYLEQNGYQLISTNTPWNAQRGDIVIWGQQGASGGSAGHVQIIVSNDPNARAISVNYVTGGQTGTAVQEWNYDAAYNYTANANGGSLAYYVYRQA